MSGKAVDITFLVQTVVFRFLVFLLILYMSTPHSSGIGFDMRNKMAAECMDRCEFDCAGCSKMFLEVEHD